MAVFHGEVSSVNKGCAECGHPTGHEKNCKILLSIFKAKNAGRKDKVKA